MGKNNKRARIATTKSRIPNLNHHDAPKKKPLKPGKPGKPATPSKRPGPAKSSHKQEQHIAPTIPFAPEDHILLIGEADLSFASSLISHHHCEHVLATVFEKDVSELEGKYPHVGENIAAVEAGGGKVEYGVDATKMNARKLGGDGKSDRIIFNFPHVGGKSTDVNRQVRYNQELLVSFFQKALPCLAPGGSIIITLFEGEPYTLWNIRDLARHSGLQVERSFKFQASAYPGYHHARTLGVVKNKSGEAGGGWKGEERASRSYIFVRKGEQLREAVVSSNKRKAKDSGSEEDDSDSDDGSD